MLKLLLVDDEILVRVGIKSIMNWEENGYTIIGEAADGQDALNKIKVQVPDIVLTDLVMDRMNGFELIKALRKEYPDVKIIVLSCYNDFENVREAMKLGASDYVFKLTLKPEELLKTLNSIAQQFVRKAPEDSVKNDKLVQKNIGVIKSRVIRTAIERSYLSLNGLREEIRELGVRVDFEQPFLLFYIQTDDFHVFNVNSKIKEKELLKFSMQNILEEVLQKFPKSDVFDFEGGDILCFINLDQQAAGQLESEILNTFELVKEYMKRYLGIGITGGISSECSGIPQIDRSVREAREALKSKFVSGSGLCYPYPEIKKKNEHACEAVSLPENLKIGLLEDMAEHLEEEGIQRFLSSYFTAIRRSGCTSSDKIRRMLLELLYPFINTARKRGVDIDEIRDEYGFTPYQAVTLYESVDSLERWFQRFTGLFTAACRRKSDNRCREEIMRVKELVRANLGSEINITMAANHVNMSESYFSHFFKKEMGISFVDFVNKARIEKAKELMHQTDYKIYEIASMVGFDNANYFSMLFKKITGKAPNDYRGLAK